MLNKPHIIEIVSPVEAKVDNEIAAIIRPELSYTAVYYRQGQWRKERKEYQKSTLIKGKNCYYFFLGFLQRVRNKLINQKIPFKIIGAYPLLPTREPKIIEVSGVIYNKAQKQVQLEMIRQALKKQRGTFVAPTGIGKTSSGISFCDAIPSGNVLWLCHTIDLLDQTYLEFKKSGFKNVFKIGGGEKQLQFSLTERNIVIATRQSFSDPVILEKYSIFFDIIIIDEVHHLKKWDSEYCKILTNLVAPVRLGLTATLPTDEEAKLICEGLLGETIAEFTIQEGNELGFIAKPVIRLLKLPKNHSISELRKYHDVYNQAIVNNVLRNQLIASTTKKHIDKNESVLIIVNLIEHGENILSVLKAQKIPSAFVQGGTEGNTRLQLKEALNQKEKCIVTTVWKEGVNVPELNVIINGAGGKSEIQTLQVIGRGLRMTPTKKEIILYDIFDPSHRFLIEHFGERLCIYSDNNWL